MIGGRLIVRNKIKERRIGFFIEILILKKQINGVNHDKKIQSDASGMIVIHVK
jgi:hypothetical protein